MLARRRPYFHAIEDAARDVEHAGDAMAAGRSAAILGMRCSHCHIESRARVTFTDSPRPAAPARAGQMSGHHRAAVQMWEGSSARTPSAGWLVRKR